MSTDLSTPGSGAAPPSPPPSPERVIDPAEYDALAGQVAEAQRAFGVLEPHQARIKRLLEDPQAAELFDNSLKAYDDYQKSRTPAVPDGMQPMFEKVTRVADFVDKYEAHAKAEAERPAREFATHYDEWKNSAVNNRFFGRLMAEHPDLKARDLQYLAQCAADAGFAPLETIWKQEGWRFGTAPQSGIPTSLRADAGDVGAAAPGTPGAPPQGVTMRDRIIQLERARRGLSA